MTRVALTIGPMLLHAVRDGEGAGLPIVFVNSLGADLRIWDGVVEHLIDTPRFDHPVVRYDKRGHGWSACPPAPYTIDDHTDDLAGLLDALAREIYRFIQEDRGRGWRQSGTTGMQKGMTVEDCRTETPEAGA